MHRSLNLQEAYQILGVPLGSDYATCKKAYHELCKLHHPDNIGAGYGDTIARINEAFATLQEAFMKEEKQPHKGVQGRQAKVFGNPMPVNVVKQRNAAEERRKALLKRQQEYQVLQEKSRQMAQQEKEQKILEQIRWIRLTDLIRKSIEEDARKEDLSMKAQEAIRKARRENDSNG